MALVEFILLWGPIAFGFLVAATYVGTTLALRAYFDDESFSASDAFRIEDDPRE